MRAGVPQPHLTTWVQLTDIALSQRRGHEGRPAPRFRSREVQDQAKFIDGVEVRLVLVFGGREADTSGELVAVFFLIWARNGWARSLHDDEAICTFRICAPLSCLICFNNSVSMYEHHPRTHLLATC